VQTSPHLHRTGNGHAPTAPAATSPVLGTLAGILLVVALLAPLVGLSVGFAVRLLLWAAGT
jgi:hypothetical protein